MDALKLLRKYNCVSKIEVLESRFWHTGRYDRIKIFLSDGTVLFATEYFDERKRKYSYHWQKIGGQLIARWDNSPHHIHIPTFPHHKHLLSGEIVESTAISLDEVLGIIQELISQKS